MKKADHATDRNTVTDFEQLVNIGPSIAADFHDIEMECPQELTGNDPFEIYQKICETSGMFHDPCVLDCMISAVDYMNGNPPQTWWQFTAMRKTKYTSQVEALRAKYNEN